MRSLDAGQPAAFDRWVDRAAGIPAHDAYEAVIAAISGEVTQLETRVLVGEYVPRLHVAIDDSVAVQVAQSCD